MNRANRWLPARPLPAQAFWPGVSPARPELRSPEPIDRPSDEWLFDEAYLFGVDLYEAQFPWEAHEAWEGAWKLASELARRMLLQGLIQCTAAVVKARAGAAAGARSLVVRGARRLERAAELYGAPDVMGLHIPRFVDELRVWTSVGDPAPEARPRLSLAVRSRDRLASLTDLRVRAADTEVTRRAEGLALRTPARPDFHDGHLLMLDAPPSPDTIDAQLAACREAVGEHPGRPLSLCWEVGAGVPCPAISNAEALAVLHLPDQEEVAEGWPPPEGVVLRSIGERETEPLIALAIDVHGGREDFHRWRVVALRDRLAGSGGMWGAFRGERLIGSLGLFESPTLLRFQEVLTRADERGKGVATSLVATALRAARARHPRAIAVIVAEPESQAERIYQRLGFRRAGTQYWLRSSTREAT